MLPRTILVVDDSPTELKVVTHVLAGTGYRVLTASDGEDALAKAAAERPDLVLLDVVLPRKNGFQVCRQLKTGPGTQGIKVVLLTSKSQDSDRFWGLRQGADGYVTKPFAEAELLSVLGGLL